VDVALDPPVPWWRRRGFLIGAPLAAIAVVLATLPMRGGNTASHTEVPVVLGPLEAPVSGFGTLIPRVERLYSAPATARVEAVEVQAGTEVREGQSLLQLVDADLEKAVADARAAVVREELTLEELALTQKLDASGQKRALAAAEGRAEVAKREQEAQRELASAGITSGIQELRAERDLRLATLDEEAARETLEISRSVQQGRLRLQQRALEAARDELRRTQTRLETLHVRATFAGTVAQVLVRPGETVASGADLVRVVRSNDLVAQVRVPQSKADGVAVGAPARLTVLGREIPARVLRLDPTVQDGLVAVELDPQGGLPADVRLGQSVSAVIENRQIREVLQVENVLKAVPNQALDLQVVTREGAVEKRKVLFGATSGSAIEVLSGAREHEKLLMGDR
jgi:HlyD family secretion protein